MHCERYTAAIVDLACGAAITRDVAAHLETCAACRGMLEAQRQLLLDVDRQLRQAVAIEPSARFVPDVMARVQRPAIRSTRILWWSAAAAALVALVTLGPMQLDRRPIAEGQASVALPPAPPTPVVDGIPATAARALSGAAATSAQSDAPRRPDRRRRAVEEPHRRAPEILVPSTQSDAIARYMALVRRGSFGVTGLGSEQTAADSMGDEVRIAPLSIAGVSVADQGSEVPRREAEQHGMPSR